MNSDAAELMTPRLLVVDDERQIHASFRLRLGRNYELVYCFDGPQALEKVRLNRFDLCFVDIHMPHMDGLTFIDKARRIDPELGFVVVSAFDTDENLRRAIPLQVYDFIPKPLPERNGFEERVPGWITRTRDRRREHTLATEANTIAHDRESARLERDVEFVASESARDALLQLTSLLTTIQAHLASATMQAALRAKVDPAVAHLLRNLEEGRKTADAAVTVASGFFDSAYGSRDSSPALVNEGVRHAIDIAMRMSHAHDGNKTVDFHPIDDHLPIYGLSGIEFLLMMSPAIGLALTSAAAKTTIGIHCEHFPRLENVSRDARFRRFFWINRKHSLGSHAGVVLALTATGIPYLRSEIESWLKADYSPLAAIPHRGLIAGIQKCRGLLGFALAPESERFSLVLALPT